MPGDFPLLDRRVVDELQQFEDHQPYLRGTIAALGFDQIGVPYHRTERSVDTESLPGDHRRISRTHLSPNRAAASEYCGTRNQPRCHPIGQYSILSPRRTEPIAVRNRRGQGS